MNAEAMWPPAEVEERGRPSAGPLGALRPVDVLGVVLFIGAATWTIVSGLLRGGHPGPMAALYLGCAAVFVASRLASGLHPLLAPVAVALVAVALMLRSPIGTFSSDPLAGPLSYGNAKSAFYMQAAVAALAVAALSTGRLRFAAIGAAILFAIVPWSSRSIAAAAMTTLLPVAWFLARRRNVARGVLLGVPVFLLVLGATAAIGILHPPRGSTMGRVLDGSLSRTRVVLWHEATEMLRAEPVTGVGPGRFSELSPTALRDPDDRWAHQEFLQQGAETGVIGLGLLIALFLWGFLRLGSSAGPGSVVPIVALGLLALALQASVDYVLHFPAVPLAASALIATPRGGIR
jgi:O-antigen ligase/polysaccharide polymerase Wzy-like membrane protein